MKILANDIMSVMETIDYGFKDENGNNIIVNDPEKWDNQFSNFYYLQTPEELLDTKCGVCWEQVELERKLFQEKNIPIKTYFIYMIDGDMLPSHTFLTFEDKNMHYWFEHSWGIYKGIHEYKDELELLLDVKEKFRREHDYIDEYAQLFIYEYQRPNFHISCDEFYQYIEAQKLIKTNKPLYFYHLVDKTVDLDKGLISLQYMYDHNMYKLFDKNAQKYINRITNDWNITKYRGKKNLSREEILDALKIFRGEEGANYVYFFRYAPFKELGLKISESSNYKDIYRININDEEVQKLVIDIFYGYDMSNSDNKELDKKYYENISKEDYFAKYNDSIKMNFSTLNHIGISFKDGYCPIKYLEKIDWE